MKSHYFALFACALFSEINSAESHVYIPATDGSYTPPTAAQTAYYYTTPKAIYEHIASIHQTLS
jgi:carbohydrate-selective porin OprB